MKKLFLISLIVLANVANAGSGSGAGPAHPSNQFCLDQGGILSTLDEGAWGGGQLGICRLKDDSVMSAMDLWRLKAPGATNTAATEFLKGSWKRGKGDIEDWAANNCEALKGKVIEYVEHLRPSSKTSLCQFEDKSLIEIWTLFSGPSYYPALKKLLQ